MGKIASCAINDYVMCRYLSDQIHQLTQDVMYTICSIYSLLNQKNILLFDSNDNENRKPGILESLDSRMGIFMYNVSMYIPNLYIQSLFKRKARS